MDYYRNNLPYARQSQSKISSLNREHPKMKPIADRDLIPTKSLPGRHRLP